LAIGLKTKAVIVPQQATAGILADVNSLAEISAAYAGWLSQKGEWQYGCHIPC
jgi:hypothetical protein